ncbi:hypothetical protein HDV03_004162 [Kappamyces sp. JEL0829]|nr:hypothetical protein HDV03_004162 [Kappamyces sp. JEL0829]
MLVLFEQRQLYGVCCRQSRHPLLNGYVQDSLAQLKLLLFPAHQTARSAGPLETVPPKTLVVLCIQSPLGSVVEAFTMAVSLGHSSELPLRELQLQFRTFLLKLAALDGILQPLPPGMPSS